MTVREILCVANNCCSGIFLVGVYWVTLWEGLKTQLLWTKKMLSELTKFGQQFTLRATLRDSETHDWIFPQSRFFFVSISLQAVIPTWKAGTNSASACHSPWRTGSPVRRSHDPPSPQPPRSRRVYPPTSDWCHLHSLDLITPLLLTLWAATHNRQSPCRCGADKSPVPPGGL